MMSQCGKNKKVAHKAWWWSWPSVYTKWSNLIGCYAEQRIVIGLAHYTTVKLDLDSFSWNENLQQKQNWTAKMLEKSRQSLSSEQPCEPKSLNIALNTAEIERISSENLWRQSTLKAIRFEFWIKGALVTVEICVVCGWWFSNQFNIVSETPCNCDTVGLEL